MQDLLSASSVEIRNRLKKFLRYYEVNGFLYMSGNTIGSFSALHIHLF